MRKSRQGKCDNKGTDQPAQPRSLISTIVIRRLNSTIYLVPSHILVSPYLLALAEQPGLCPTQSEHSRDSRFLSRRGIGMRVE